MSHTYVPFCVALSWIRTSEEKLLLLKAVELHKVGRNGKLISVLQVFAFRAFLDEINTLATCGNCGT